MRKILLALAALSAAVALHAQDVVDGGASSVAMPFSRYTRNTEALSMGGTDVQARLNRIFAARTLDAIAGYQAWGPSLASSSRDFIMDVHGSVSPRLNVSAALAIDSGRDYSAKDLSLRLGASYKFKVLYAGAALKYYRTVLSSDEALSAVAADGWVAARFGGFSAATGLSNIGSDVRGFSLPSSVYVSAGYLAKLGSDYSFRAAFQTDWFFYGAVTSGMGIEFGAFSIVYARAGYHFGSQSAVIPSYASVGVGLRYGGVKFDAAYLFASEALGGTMQYTVGYEF